MAEGEDPKGREKIVSAFPTVAELLAEYERVELPRLRLHTGGERMRALRKDLAPLMDRKVIEVSRREIVLQIDEVRERAPVQGKPRR